MDQRTIDWMHDDITWCGNECDNTECFRNQVNRRQKTGYFTMAMLKGTDLCPSYKSNCKTCKNRLDLEKLDYSNDGCKHTKMDGFICLAHEYEGLASWMVGLDENKAMCECYKQETK